MAKQFFYFYSIVVTAFLTVLFLLFKCKIFQFAFQILRKKKIAEVCVKPSFKLKLCGLLKVLADMWVWILIKEKVTIFKSDIFFLWAPNFFPISRNRICVVLA